MIKITKKDYEKKHVKDIKIFLKNKKIKGKKMPEKYIKILLKKKKKKRHQYYKERKQKLPEYRRNYYLTHKK